MEPGERDAARRTELAEALAALAPSELQRTRADPVRLAGSQRVLRTQPFPPPWRQHFELLALCTAGPAAPAFGFEAAALIEQCAFYAGLVAGLLGEDHPVRVEIADLDRPGPGTRLEQTVCEPLRDLRPGARVVIDAGRTRGAGYYAGAAFRIAVDIGGDELELADGGVVDWTARLLGDRRERVVVSGLGVERLAAAWSARSR